VHNKSAYNKIKHQANEYNNVKQYQLHCIVDAFLTFYGMFNIRLYSKSINSLYYNCLMFWLKAVDRALKLSYSEVSLSLHVSSEY